ncbi:hypothetical protein HH310_12550 [Actinoplanes sp. TBRC 11911]|uniref:hypothetical protein n=1 Tax=Actinoplanes sp. TBRC 11911 TaxID=2729386 RepID=UPI00145D49F4|nr:hypothetical protein [Actinoplanes sp. TBRC 11911]NMO52023.1 hypothetical protein [Actinoplanes sp. TBRC 11911]
MARYQVAHKYRSTRDGQQFGPYLVGDVVELSDEDAAWVNRDSPGCLEAEKPAKPEPDPDPEPDPADDAEPEREKPPTPNRQRRGGANRSSS